VRGRAALAAALIALMPAAAGAQGGRVQVGLGVARMGSVSLGSTAATLTGNGGPPLTLFSVETGIDSAVGGAVTLGVRVWPAVDVEVRGSYGRPELTARTSGDAEGAEPAEVGDRLREFTVAGLVVVCPAAWRVGPRAGLFAAGGVGFLRHLHEGEGLVEDGRVYLAGGGVMVRLAGGSGGPRTAGLRFDAGLAARTGAAARRTVVAPLVGASFYVRF
jgi:hypothetical protein